MHLYWKNLKVFTNPGIDLTAAGYKAAGKKAGPHGGGKKMGDMKSGGTMPLNCDDAAEIDDAVCSDIRSSAADVDERRVGDGDGEDRRFLFSVATIASFTFLCCQK